MKPNLVGKEVKIKGGHYAGHWGFVIAQNDDGYTVSGGSIGELAPIFDRDEFTVVGKTSANQRKRITDSSTDDLPGPWDRWDEFWSG